MNCRIDFEDGEVKTVRADNGSESRLYNEIRAIVPDSGEALIEYDNALKQNLQPDANNEPSVDTYFQVIADKSKQIAQRFNGSATGFFDKRVGVANLKKELAQIGFGVKQAVNGSYYATKNGKFVNLFKQLTTSDSRKQNNDLDSKLKKIVGDFGISVEELETSRFKGFGVKGIADVAQRAIYLAHNRSIDTMPEEVAHFYVEMLQYSGSPLYDSMMNDIVKFPLYNQVVEEYANVYGNDATKLKKEAIGKAIAKYVVSNYEGREANRVKNWFNKVLNWFQGKMAVLGFEQPIQLVNYFDLAAKNILNAQLSSDFNGNGTFRQQSTNKFDRKLLANDKLIRTNGAVKERFVDDEWKPIKRVSDVIKEKGFGYIGTRTVEQQKLDTIKADFGTKVHADVSTLVKEETGEIEHDDSPGESGFKQQLRRLVQELIEQHPGGKFYTEINIFKTKNTKGQPSELAGTVDLLVIDKDEVAHIYDWKTVTELLQKNSLDTKQFKKKWFEQLSQYRGILSSEYGITKFGESRIIPMDVRFTDEIPTSLTFGNQNGKANALQTGSDALLSPVPLLEENTDDKIVNSYLNELRDKLKNIRNSKVFNRADLIFEYENAIAKILITKDINEAHEVVEREARFYDNVLERIDAGEPLTINDVARLNEIQDFYKNAFENRYAKEGSLISDLASRVLNNYGYVQDAIEVTLNGFGVGQNDIVKGETSVLNQLSDYDIPIFQAFQDLLTRAWSSIEVKLRVKKQNLLSIKKQIEQETGKTGIDMFDDILQFENGQRTRKLISKKNKQWGEFYKANSKELFKVIDRENPLALDAYFKAVKKTKLGGLITDFAEFETELRKRVKDFQDSRSDYDNEYALKWRNKQISSLLSANSTRLTIPVEYLTEKYKAIIHDKPDSGLAKLYNAYLETNRIASAECDSNIRGTMLPFVRKSIVQAMTNAPINLRTASGMLNKFRVDEWVSEETDSKGERIYKIPLKYDVNLKNGDAIDQSYDLVEVLALWQETVESNVALQKIENTTKVFKHALKQNRQYVLNNGKITKKNGEFETAKLNTATLENFDDYVNKYVYGVGLKDDNVTVLGYSRNKLIKSALSYFSAKSLFGSVFSGIANITGGVANIFSVAIRNGNFSMTDVLKSVQLLSTANPEMYALKELVQLDVNTYENPKNKELSVDWLNRNVTFDKVYFVQKIGDNAVQNITLGAWLQNTKLVSDNGNVRFVKTDDKSESLLTQIKPDADGNYKIDGLDLNNEQHNLELFKFREKIRNDIAEIIGTASEYDQFLAGNEIKGAMLLQFRRWILPMYNSRFGKLKYNGIQDRYKQGKYVSLAQTVFTNKFNNLISELVGLKDGATFDEIITERWEKEHELHRDLSYEDFRKNVVNDLHSTMADLVMLSLIMGMKYMLDSDDDDRPTWKKVASRGLARSGSELSFWFSPTSFTDILNAPVPIIGLATSLSKIIKNLGFGFWDTLADNEEDADKEFKKAGDETAKLTIGLNTWYAFKKELDE